MYTLLLALGIAFGFSAIMTLVILGFAPLLIITGAIRALSYRKHLVKNKSALSEAGKVNCLMFCLSDNFVTASR